MISQTVAMAIAGTSTTSPMSRPSSFLLNSQVVCCSLCDITNQYKLIKVSHHISCPCVVVFPPCDLIWEISPDGSPAWELLGRVQPQSADLSALGFEECRRAGAAEMVYRPVCISAQPPAGSPLPLRVMLWVQGSIPDEMDRFTFLKMVKTSLETNDYFVAVGYTCNKNLEKCNLSTFIWSGKKHVGKQISYQKWPVLLLLVLWLQVFYTPHFF